MNKDQLMEAVQELRQMGFEVIPKDRARIPDQDKQEIAEDLQYYKDSIKTRLLALGHQDEASNFKEHELQSLEASLVSIYCIQADLKEGQILDLFRHSVSLGCELLDGDGPHQYDEQRSLRYEIKRRAQKGGKQSKRKPWADALAKKLCHLSDDEIYWTLADEGDKQVRAGNDRFDIIFKEDPITLTHDMIQAIPFDDLDTPKAPQTMRLSTFLKYYVRPARKKPDKV